MENEFGKFPKIDKTLITNIILLISLFFCLIALLVVEIFESKNN
jgi:hypothetical protein